MSSPGLIHYVRPKKRLGIPAVLVDGPQRLPLDQWLFQDPIDPNGTLW